MQGQNGDSAEGCLTRLPPCLLLWLQLGHPQSTAAAVETDISMQI